MSRILIALISFFLGIGSLFAQQSASSSKRERNYIKEGNAYYNEKDYSNAEIAYRKALQENQASETAMFNLASTLARQASLASGAEDGNNPAVEAQKIFQDLASSASNDLIMEKSLYNLGNMAFNREEYQQSIDLYKRTLRKNPDNDKARDNLRLAQLKLEEQQNQDQNQDQDQDQDQNQNQDQKQDQNQDQNQNQDQQQDQNQDQDQEQNQDQQQQQQDQQQQQQQNDRNGISDRNAEQILQAMENQENATRKKIEAQKAKQEQANSRKVKTDKPW